MLVKTATAEDDYSAGLERAAEILKKSDDILVICHASPDGDAVGSATALCSALRKLGKKANYACSDTIPQKYGYLLESLDEKDFSPRFIVAVDIAATNLFGEKLRNCAGHTDLCIDHHVSNARYAAYTLLNARAAATCEIVFDLIDLLNVNIDKHIANCIYTGLSTDTGCFRYSNTTPKTLRCAAELIEKGAESAWINKKLFETSTKQRMEIEKEAMNTLQYSFSGKAAVICITKEMCDRSGASEEDTEGIASLPAKIEGVLVGVTIKEKQPGFYKISVRTNGGVNASEICVGLGGGGHAAAAGCQIEGTLEEAERAMNGLVGKALKKWDERNIMH